MKRSSMPRRSSRLRVKGKRRFPNREDPAYLDYLRSLPCLICARDGMRQEYRTTPHHWPTKNNGGHDHEAVPLCGDGVRGHHGLFHQIGVKSFESRYELNLKAEAARLYAEYQERS